MVVRATSTAFVALILTLCISNVSFAQGWGEQVPLKFGIVGPAGNLTVTEFYRRQLAYNNANVAIGLFNSSIAACGVMGDCRSGGSGGGGGSGVLGSAQSSTPTINPITVNQFNTITGSNNTIGAQTGMTGNTLNQSANGASQTSSFVQSNAQSTGGMQAIHSGSGALNAIVPAPALSSTPSPYLNRLQE